MTQARLRPNPEVAYRRVGGDFVLVHLRTNQVYTLNATGGRVWELLDEHGERGRVLADLSAEFDVEEQQLDREVSELIDHLLAQGLLLSDA